jgi:hypothetical protein
MKKNYIKAEVLDQKFDNKEDIIGHLDLKNAKRPGLDQKRVNVDFPSWMVKSLDNEARRLGVTRQSVIKVWIAERLEHSVV